MLKPPIILPIVPSRLWLLTQGCLFVAVAVLSYWVGGELCLLVALIVGGVLGWRAHSRQPRGVLSLSVNGSLMHGRWCSDSHAAGAELDVRCDYLGPWLIGLYVGQQRVWLWPDSAPAGRLREVRKSFHRPGH